jgi:hypothetical protein
MPETLNKLTVEEAIAFLQSLPDSAKKLPLWVSVECDCVHENVVNDAKVGREYVLWNTTGNTGALDVQ